MLFYVCLLFAAVGMGSASSLAEFMDVASSQPETQRLTLGSTPTHAFGAHVGHQAPQTTFDESRLPMASFVDFGTQVEPQALQDDQVNDVTIASPPVTLRRFGARKVVMTEAPLKRWGAQVKVLSELPADQPLLAGMQRWGSQGSTLSAIPVEASDDELRRWGSQDTSGSNIPVELSEVVQQRIPDQNPIVLSETPLRHSWNNRIVLSSARLSRAGHGSATDYGAPLKTAYAESTPAASHRAGRATTQVAQDQLAMGPDATDSYAEVTPTYEPVVQLWRYAVFAICLLFIAAHQFRLRTQAVDIGKPLLAA